MHTVESSAVVSIIILSIMSVIIFSFELERKVTNEIKTDSIKQEYQYKINGEKEFYPENILRAISNFYKNE